MIRVDVKPDNFRWLRERAGMDVAALTRRFPKYADWEAGAAQPTLKQIKRLARAVHAPVGYFFFAAPLEEALPLPDFRTVGSRPLTHPGPNLLDTVYLCQRRQDWYREFVRAEREGPLAFVVSARLGDDVEAVAASIRATLGLDLEERRALPTSAAAHRRFLRAADTLGVLVMVSGVVGSDTHRRLDPAEFRGFALADKHAAAIFVNGTAGKAAQTFTLAHELAHLWLGQSALSDSTPEVLPEHEIEAWCHRVAAEILVLIAVLREEYRQNEEPAQALARLARHFKVNALVILRRLRDMGGLTQAGFHKAYEAELERLKSVPKGSGGDFRLTQTDRVGSRFAHAVVTSTLEGGTSFTEAFRLLGCRRTRTFDELARRRQGLCADGLPS